MTFPKRVLDALNYNEQKVLKGVADCIGASGYLREAGELNFYQKLQGLQSRNELNDRATTKTLHVSLNFDPSEKLSPETLRQIASQYMERLGFGSQPYLVYQHRDAGHPHLHIVSTLIRADGRRINTHNLGRHGSEKARKELETAFGLVRAEAQKPSDQIRLKHLDQAKVLYGQSQTKSNIAGVVGFVVRSYKFTSLPEFNAALRPFNVLADQGSVDGRIFRHGGLVYRALDEKGEKIGVPIKASSLPGGPTLEHLQGRFGENERLREVHREAVKAKIDSCFSFAPVGLSALIAALDQKGVFTLPRRSGDGRLYGLTFVDHQTRCVFNGSDLGKGYTATGLQSRLATVAAIEGRAIPEKAEERPGLQTHGNSIQPQEKSTEHRQDPMQRFGDTLGKVFVEGKPSVENVPSELLHKKRKKKRRNPGL